MNKIIRAHGKQLFAKKRGWIRYSLLTKADLSISEIVIVIGLSSKSYFSKIFKEKYTISPSEFRKK